MELVIRHSASLLSDKAASSPYFGKSSFLEIYFSIYISDQTYLFQVYRSS